MLSITHTTFINCSHTILVMLAAGKAGEAVISTRKEATVAAGNKRANAHIDDELGIEDDDYNANYDEEEVVPERPASGVRAGEEVDEESSEAQEVQLSRSRSNRQSSFRRSRSADIGIYPYLYLSNSRVLCMNCVT